MTWGYPTENAYYRDASSSDAVLAIRIPFLAISALDDPVSNLPLGNKLQRLTQYRSRYKMQFLSKNSSRTRTPCFAPRHSADTSRGSNQAEVDGMLGR